MNGDDVKRIRDALGEARGRRVSQGEFAAIIGLAGANAGDHVRGFEDESRPISGPVATALRYLSQGLPGFRGDLPEYSFQAVYQHAGTPRHAQVISRYWWPRFVAPIVKNARGFGVLGDVQWIDEPGDQADWVLERCREAFMLDD